MPMSHHGSSWDPGYAFLNSPGFAVTHAVGIRFTAT
eukprot:CAMPEP_0172720940 /NCGR_PEP_ID=MMETSP1074-20121228/78033_1 /TAXON_ID=2916 /ORGANISM="Ceratium fusus, Strain PA161109" /LENGTH=35 /DNA_ID= /DNA_START= /DNA_END= /DNA_ORIENTATION=